jgi:hypothetical protein
MKKLARIGAGSNAFTFSFAEDLLAEIRESYYRDLHPILSIPENRRLFEGGRVIRQPLGSGASEYFIVSFLDYPLLWLSSNTPQTYDIYRRFFDSLDIEDDIRQLVDYDEKIVVYCGSLVIGDRSLEHSFHVDYQPGANAYSLLTPLFELDPGHGDLLYKVGNERVETYPYAVGEACVLGDTFYHCTEPYDSTGHLRVLITITLGTDKMEHWDVLKQTVATQSNFLVQPCGHAIGTCQCAARVLAT